jgi:hypothetical protein
MVVARIPVTDRDEAGLLTQDQLGRCLPTRGVDAKPHTPVAGQHPHPQGVVVALVTGLIGVTHRGVLQLGVQLRHGLLQRLAEQPVRLGHRPQTEAHAHDVREHGLYLALRQVELPGQCAHQGQGTWTELAAGQPCG